MRMILFTHRSSSPRPSREQVALGTRRKLRSRVMGFQERSSSLDPRAAINRVKPATPSRRPCTCIRPAAATNARTRAAPPNWGAGLRCQRSVRGCTTHPRRLQTHITPAVSKPHNSTAKLGRTNRLAVVVTHSYNIDINCPPAPQRLGSPSTITDGRNHESRGSNAQLRRNQLHEPGTQEGVLPAGCHVAELQLTVHKAVVVINRNLGMDGTGDGSKCLPLGNYHLTKPFV